MQQKQLLIHLGLFFFLLSPFAFSQKYTISGYIQEAGSGEKLIGASVYVPKLRAGTTTNNYGFFSLTIPADSVKLGISYIGYKSKFISFKLNKNISLNIQLEESEEAKEVEIRADRVSSYTETTRMGSIDVPIQQIRSIPALLGEVDVIKAIQLLPGVQSGSEGSSGLYVRGGGPDQNLILLDDAPVYNVSHLFGFFSVFNADAIQNVQLVKGGFPARYGGRLSSVLDISLKEGNLHQYETDASIGVVASKVTVQGPIKKDKSSFIVSARRTYIDAVSKPILKALTESDPNSKANTGYYFYDFNAKVNYLFSPKNRLYLSYYGGSDRFYLDQTETNNAKTNTDNITAGMNWGNQTATLRWNHLFTNQLFSNTILAFSRYQFAVDVATENLQVKTTGNTRDYSKAKYNSSIVDWRFKTDFDYLPNPQHAIKFGIGATHHTFAPAVAQINIQGANDLPINTEFTPAKQAYQAVETALYAEDDFEISEQLKANAGLHFGGFWVENTFFPSLQPRLAVRYLLHGVSVKASFATVRQYIHLLTNSGVSLPTDLWLPATQKVPPQSSQQIAFGLAKDVFKGQFEASIETYYKWMQNVIEYKSGANFLDAPTQDWQEKVTSGKGNAYGAEFFFQRKTGRITGWIGYTLAWSNRQFADLNKGEVFPYRYDRRHDVSFVVNHALSKRIDLAGTWVYGTGNAMSLPNARFTATPSFMRPWELGNTTYTDYGTRNSYRLPAYHRLDVGVSFHREYIGKHVGKWDRTLNISAYNAYDRHNAFFIYLGQNRETGEKTFRQASLFPIIPSISYSAHF